MSFGSDECLLDNYLFTLTDIITLSNTFHVPSSMPILMHRYSRWSLRSRFSPTARWIFSKSVHCSLYRLGTDNPQKTHRCLATDIMYCCQACLPMHCLAMDALLLLWELNGLFMFCCLGIASRWPAMHVLQSSLPGGTPHYRENSGAYSINNNVLHISMNNTVH
jgi:hypothetical protein